MTVGGRRDPMVCSLENKFHAPQCVLIIVNYQDVSFLHGLLFNLGRSIKVKLRTIGMSPPGGSSQTHRIIQHVFCIKQAKTTVDEKIVVLKDLQKRSIRSDLVRDATDSEAWFCLFQLFRLVPRKLLAVRNVAPGKGSGTL